MGQGGQVLRCQGRVRQSKFQVPPENLTTQGYGEQHLKVPTEGSECANRRVTARRITGSAGQRAN